MMMKVMIAMVMSVIQVGRRVSTSFKLKDVRVYM